jgi:eukaryotic-like serine/threonine-protein kinase
VALTAGTRLGPYEVLAPVGAGGMGEVYRARDPRLGRDVAVKVLPAAFSADPERLHRFEQEARAAAALNHPNILAVHDIGQHDGAPYIVSELLEGATLRDRLSGGALPVRKAVEYAVQIAHGLAAAHEKGITHRDLKPENIFVTTDGRVKILDFGLAKLTQAEPAVAALSALPTTPPDTSPGVVLGTIGYMSPEQVRGLPADHRSDIFAFGAILYEMLSGRRAFHRETGAETMTAILKEDPAELPTAERHIPPTLERIVDRCLEKNSAARFQSTRDLAFALEGLSSSSDAVPIDRSIAGRNPGAWLAWAVAGVLALTGIAVAPLVVAHFREVPARPEVIRFSVFPATNTAFSPAPIAPFQAVSPDGRRLAFLATRGGPSLLWVRSLDSLDARALPGTEGASLPFWSPDSRFIGFFLEGKLKKIEATGGPAQTVSDAPAGEGGTWNRDGVILFGSSADGLFRVSAAGGQPVAITKPDASRQETSHRLPDFLPDGRHFVYLAQPSKTIHVGSLDSADTTQLLNADSKAIYAPPGYLLFVRENTLLAQPFDIARLEARGDPVPIAQQVRANPTNGRAAFSASERVLTYRTGEPSDSQLLWLDRSGKRMGVLGDPAPYGDVELSPDGKQVAVDIRDRARARDIWIFDIARGVRTRFTFDSANDISGRWSPNGDRLVFGSNRDAQAGLYLKQSSGTGREQVLLASKNLPFPDSWSPDGRFLLYDAENPKTGWDLWVLPLSGERKPQPFVQTEFREEFGRFSPDGRWIAYRSNESGRFEVYVVAFPGPGGKWQVSTAGGQFPRWRHDGKEIFYVAADNKLMAGEVNGQGAGFDVGTLRPLFELQPAGGYPYDVAGDAQRFLVRVPMDQTGSEPVDVVVNWAAGLKQ